MSRLIISLLILIPLIANSQNTNADSLIGTSKRDTVYIEKMTKDNGLSDYTEILEKTNNQLSLWWNPYGVFIAALGLLFAVLAIVATYLVYRQSADNRNLMKSSLDDHRKALDKLIDEKNSQYKLLESSLDKTILEYTQKLESDRVDNKVQILEFIEQLEKQKEIIDIQAHTYRHSGWDFKDIPEVNQLINDKTLFQAQISLNSPLQAFVIYVRVKASDGRQYWLGFGGNEHHDKAIRYQQEYTYHRIYNLTEVVINENIFSYFKKGFPNLTAFPLNITTIRLRASNADQREITFKYRIG